jgi:hypothetical protein
LELARQQHLKGEPTDFDPYTFPTELPGQVKKMIDDLHIQIDKLNDPNRP